MISVNVSSISLLINTNVEKITESDFFIYTVLWLNCVLTHQSRLWQGWGERGKVQTVAPMRMRALPATACPASRAAPTVRTTHPVWHERTAPFAWLCSPSSASACWSSSLAWCSSTTFAGIRSVLLHARNKHLGSRQTDWFLWSLIHLL